MHLNLNLKAAFVENFDLHHVDYIHTITLGIDTKNAFRYACLPALLIKSLTITYPYFSQITSVEEEEHPSAFSTNCTFQ
jgi:hypothetical protein